MNTPNYWSRLPGFFALDIAARRERLALLPLKICAEDFLHSDFGLGPSDLDALSENVLGAFSLPLSCAVNFLIDGQPAIIPMAIEEPSIVAACSKMAKLVAEHGGFHTSVDRALIKGQIQLYDVPDTDHALTQFANNKAQLLEKARALCPRMHARGGGVVDIELRIVASAQIGPFVLIEPLIDVVDAMGANIVNTIVEGLSLEVAALFGGKMGLRIVSNYCDRRLANAWCTLPFRRLAIDDAYDFGQIIAERMRAAHALAEADIYRACTHNKGILNGVDAVALATGNDFRAIEAGAHAYASRHGHYGPLTTITLDHDKQLLHASLTMPLAVGVVGDLMRVHPGVLLAHKLLGDHAANSQKLSSVMVSVGLSQCLAALLALSQDGIQKGHMKLHRKKLSRISKLDVQPKPQPNLDR